MLSPGSVYRTGLLTPAMHKVLPRRSSRLAILSRKVGRLGVPVLVIAALAHHAALITTPQLFILLALGFSLGAFACIGAGIALSNLWRNGGSGWRDASRALLYGAMALAPVAGASVELLRHPLLADVSTDIETPPALPPLVPGGPLRPFETGALQAEAYPDLVSRRFRIAPGELHAAALNVAGRMGWTITAELPPGLPDEPTRFQAEAKSLLFGFRDDIALRIQPDPVGARLDIRSASRYGRHDLGANARRIRTFLDGLDATLLEAYGVLEPVDDDVEPEDLPLLAPGEAPRRQGPPPMPASKPGAESDADPGSGTDPARLEELPEDLSEIYQGDDTVPPGAPAN